MNRNRNKKVNSPNTYFLQESEKKKAKYKLVCEWLPQFVAKWRGKKTMVFFGLNKRPNNGLDWLIQKGMSLRDEFKSAKIFDNQTGEVKYVIPGRDQEALKNIGNGNK